MELNKYDIFIQIIQNGSLTKTAHKIGYTQSAISHLIASMETELGVTLLIRNRSGISLTPEGEMLFPYIQSISKSYANLYECANSLRGLQSGVVRLNVTPSISTQILPDTISYFCKHYPGVRLELNMGDYFSNYRNVIDANSDFGVICTNEAISYVNLNQCEIVPFTCERMMVIIPINHPVSEEETFPVEALREEKYILVHGGAEETNPIFNQHDITPNILFYVRDAFSIMAMVEKGIGISIIPETSLLRNPYKIIAKELSVPAYRKMSLVYRKQPILSNAARTFMDILLKETGDFSL